MNDPRGNYKINPGAMNWDHIAPRDPVFYRWNKFIDRMFDEHRFNMKPHSKDEMKFKGIEVVNFSVQLLPEKHHEKKGAMEKENHFYTYMENKNYKVWNIDGEKGIPINKKKVLDHVPFKYKLTVRNKSSTNASVVFRVFMAPDTDEPLSNWRNMFIELDKFVVNVGPGKSGEVFDITQAAWKSSVVKQPHSTVEDLMSGKPVETSSNCNCGWPINLLIPRGNERGMKAKLYVLATNWNEDALNPQEKLDGGVSYCSRRDENSMYPDRRPMGFPFDRMIINSNDDDHQNPVESLRDLVKGVPNSKQTDVYIHFMDSNPHCKFNHGN